MPAETPKSQQPFVIGLGNLFPGRWATERRQNCQQRCSGWTVWCGTKPGSAWTVGRGGWVTWSRQLPCLELLGSNSRARESWLTPSPHLMVQMGKRAQGEKWRGSYWRNPCCVPAHRSHQAV